MSVGLRSLAGIFVSLTFVAQPGQAVELQLTVEQSHVITDPEGKSRVLLSFSGLREIEGEWVTRAALVCRLGGLVPSESITLKADVVEAEWDRTATWTTPWVVPGGDLDGGSDADAVLKRGRAATYLSLDVTNQVREVVEGHAANRGFMLLPGRSRETGFSVDELRVLGSLEAATLVIHYRKLTALGIRDGGRAIIERRETAEGS